MQGPVCIIANAGSGRKRTELLNQLTEPFAARTGSPPRLVTVRNPDRLSIAARAARDNGYRTIIAAGGDGTVAAVAEQLVGSDVAMGVLPMGTFNYFSRSLGLPEDPAEAAAALAAAEPRQIAVGEVNGRLFLNNASLGLYAAILEDRERIYGQVGRSRLVAYWSVLRTIGRFRRPSSMHVEIDGEARRLRTPMVFVAANGYQLDEFGLPGAECLADGKFAVFLAPDCSRWQLVVFAAKLALRRAKPERDFQLLCGAEIVIRTRRRRSIARDGERDRMRPPFIFRLVPEALTVLAPDPAAVASSAGIDNRVAAEGPASLPLAGTAG